MPMPPHNQVTLTSQGVGTSAPVSYKQALATGLPPNTAKVVPFGTTIPSKKFKTMYDSPSEEEYEDEIDDITLDDDGYEKKMLQNQ